MNTDELLIKIQGLVIDHIDTSSKKIEIDDFESQEVLTFELGRINGFVTILNQLKLIKLCNNCNCDSCSS